MSEKYQSFKDLPPEVAERLRKKLVEEGGSKAYMKSIREQGIAGPDYTEEELSDIVDAFNTVNLAVMRGLPNQLYQMLARAVDSELARKAYAKRLIWLAHEDDDQAEQHLQAFARCVRAAIDKRGDEWDFNGEYFLHKEGELEDE